jgi:hypothetical protein
MMMKKRRKIMEPKFEVVINGSYSRTFHTNVEVGKTSIEHYATYLTSNCWNQICEVQGLIVADMVADILHVKGVEDVFVKPYEVSVHLDITNANPRWDENVDRIVHNAFRRLAEQSQPRKIVIHNSEQGRRKFSTNFEVSRTQIQDFWRPLRDSSEQYLKEIGSDGARLVRKLMDLPGVTEIWIHPYEVTVEISKAFDWNSMNLQNRIEEVFEEVFGSDICFTWN